MSREMSSYHENGQFQTLKKADEDAWKEYRRMSTTENLQKFEIARAGKEQFITGWNAAQRMEKILSDLP